MFKSLGLTGKYSHFFRYYKPLYSEPNYLYIPPQKTQKASIGTPFVLNLEV